MPVACFLSAKLTDEVEKRNAKRQRNLKDTSSDALRAPPSPQGEG
jgi:hypothetical protein